MPPPLNFLLLQGEDLGLHLGCYGDPTAHTPHLDALASQGLRFTQAFSMAPVCAPSRGGMVTGRYPISLGIHQMRSMLQAPQRTLMHGLRDAGYFVNWNTKLDFNFEPAAGWRDAAENWHEADAPEEPFFLYENFHVTHESCMFPERPAWHGPLPPEAAGAAKHRPEDMRVPPWLRDCAEVRQQLVRYADAVSVLDAQVGQRLAWLEAQGVADRTMVIFLSDHGRGLPREKRWCYDAGIHLPLIVRLPEGPGRAAAENPALRGRVCEDLVSWVDLAPTILSLAGVAIPDEMEGQVFLGPDRAPPREACFAARDRMDEVFDRVRAIRDARWLYLRNFAPRLPWAQCQSYMESQEVMGVMRRAWRDGGLQGAERVFFAPVKPEEELYDVAQDPDCLQNLAGKPEFEDILARQRQRLQAHLQATGDLGAVSEEDLIRSGLLTDGLQAYRERVQALPEGLQPDPFPFPMTLREAAAAGFAPA